MQFAIRLLTYILRRLRQLQLVLLAGQLRCVLPHVSLTSGYRLNKSLFGGKAASLDRRRGSMGKVDSKTTNSTAVDLTAFATQTRHIPSMISEAEAQALFMLSAFGSGSGDIVEIGSWLGKSTVYLALGCQVSDRGLVHAIDTFEGNPDKQTWYTAPLKPGESILERFQANLKLAGLTHRVKTHPMPSTQGRKVLKKAKVRARGVFIDACHDYTAVKQDIDQWRTAVAPGGWLALHDYRPAFPGSVRAIDEFRARTRSFQEVAVIDSLILFAKTTPRRRKTSSPS